MVPMKPQRSAWMGMFGASSPLASPISLSLSPTMLVGSRGGHRKSEGRRHESQRPRGGSTSNDLLLVAGARRHGALDHLFGSHGRHGHGVEEWPANGNHVPRL